MAGIKVVATTEGEIALTAATAKTILQIVAPTNQRLLMKSFAISFDGTSSSAEPVNVELCVQSSAGTSSAGTPVKDGDPGSETLQSTSRITITAEPTTGNILRRYLFHPQGGGIERVFSFDEAIAIPGGTRLGLRCTAPANVNAVAHMTYEE
jgi:hypothetical protein